MSVTFFAAISRMKYIERWALMRSSRPENLSEHAMEVAMIAHALCTIGNIRCGKNLNADRAAVIGLFHDASEIITGDMPTPVKYGNSDIRSAYKEVEKKAEERLLEKLPDDLKDTYRAIFFAGEDESEQYLRRLVKAADKISALIKCIDEENAGNREFSTAQKSLENTIREMEAELPEAADFMRDFFPAYGRTLDELL